MFNMQRLATFDLSATKKGREVKSKQSGNYNRLRQKGTYTGKNID